MTWLLMKFGISLTKALIGGGSFLVTLELYARMHRLSEALRPRPTASQVPAPFRCIACGEEMEDGGRCAACGLHCGRSMQAPGVPPVG
tara:strand:- start:41206 stop:41469 length:264 start_codon:yes stop_codon:yes gene_type:complete